MEVACLLRRGLWLGGVWTSASGSRDDTVLLAPLIHWKWAAFLHSSELASGPLGCCLLKGVYGKEGV